MYKLYVGLLVVLMFVKVYDVNKEGIAVFAIALVIAWLVDKVQKDWIK